VILETSEAMDFRGRDVRTQSRDRKGCELRPLLAETGIEVAVPTDGLRYGETLAWYNEHL